MTSKKMFILRSLLLTAFTFQLSSCVRQVKEKPIVHVAEIPTNKPAINLNQDTEFPQIHTNLNGMVREFVRTIFQDKKGNFWFGTNGNGIIRYDGQTLEKMTIPGIHPNMRVLEIVEDKAGNLWFASSDGLIKYDGGKFTTFSKNDASQDDNKEIWGLSIDRSGKIWVGSLGGMSHFDGETFRPFELPKIKVENAKHMLSNKLIFKILEDKSGTIWLVTDGNGIFKFKDGEFIHLTTKNGLTDNSVSDILEDKHGNVWIGTFNGGMSKYDGKVFTNYTKEGIIEGTETYNLLEDRLGNIWFSAEGYGVYRFDGANFTQFKTDNGLTTDVVQSIFEDNKGQLWFSTWQGICIFDGQKFVNAKDMEPWTK